MREQNGALAHQPVDAVVERLNDPAVAAALVTILDNAELLSTLVLGFSGFIERSETIVDSVAEGLGEIQAVAKDAQLSLPPLGELAALADAMARAAPVMTEVLNSSMVNNEMIALLSMLSESATEGAQNARRSGTTISGFRGAFRALRDPEVGRGLGVMIEIARSLGRRLGDAPRLGPGEQPGRPARSTTRRGAPA